MILQEVPVQIVNQVLPHVEYFLDSALQYSCGEYTIDDARVYITSGSWSLIVALDDNGKFRGAAAVQYFNRPRDRVAFIVALGGRLVTSSETRDLLFNIFRANGATSVEAAARDNILRLWQKYGLQKKYNIISASL